MLLKEIITINYKSAKKTTLQIKSNSPTVLIGENDCGKTRAGAHFVELLTKE